MNAKQWYQRRERSCAYSSTLSSVPISSSSRKQNPLIFLVHFLRAHQMAISSASAACSVPKIAHFPVSIASLQRTQMAVGASKARPERWVGSLCVKAEFGSSKGGAGLLERPGFEQSQFESPARVQEGGDIGKLKNRGHTGSGDSYRVLLVDDLRHTENLVAKVLPQVVPSVTPDDARKLFHESRENGLAVVIVAVKEHAEFYAQMMIRGGLQSTIEPDSNVV